MLRLLRADLEREMRGLAASSPPSGSHEPERVAVAVSADSLATWVLPALDPLVKQGLTLELITDDQDFTAQWLRDGLVLGCITALRQPLRGCRVQALGAMDYLLLASPDYAQRHFGPPPLRAHHPLAQQLTSHCFVSFNRKDDMPEQIMAQWYGLRAARLNQIFVPSSQAMIEAACQGWGLTVLPRLLVTEQLARGELLDLVPGRSLTVPLYWHCWNLESALVDSLCQALVGAAARVLQPWP